MKKILTLVLVSILGGATTLGAYKAFIEKEQTIAIADNEVVPEFVPTAFNTTNTKLTAAENIDFTTAAQKTVDAVVHVKSLTISNRQ